MDLIKHTRKIYSALQDELSRNIFENRLLYSFTGNYDFIRNIVPASFDDFSVKEAQNKLINFMRQFGAEIIVYGAGHFGGIFNALCNGVKISAYCDSNSAKWGKKFYGHDIISPEELKMKYGNSTVMITVIDKKFTDDITQNLISMGVHKDRIINFLDVLEQNNIDPYFCTKTQYFDSEIILPNLSKDEVFIDAGCFSCDTASKFAEFCNNEYQRIIAFEPDPKQYALCVENSKSIKNITLNPSCLWNVNRDLFFNADNGSGSSCVTNESKGVQRVKAVTLDDVLNGEQVTFIKMDIEGAELNALKGAEQTILKYRPKLAICVYHKLSDIWEIPQYILSLHNDYKLYLRHYSMWEAETVIYAV